VRSLLQWWSRSSSRQRRASACTNCCSEVRAPSMGATRKMATSRCSTRCWQRAMGPHHRQAGISNLLLHDDVRAKKAARSIESTAKQGCSPRWNEIDLPRGNAVAGSRRLRVWKSNLMPCRKNRLCIIV
jgi:hypothetical protein